MIKKLLDLKLKLLSSNWITIITVLLFTIYFILKIADAGIDFVFNLVGAF